MKKTIATIAGLALTGSIIGTASGAVSLSGDARARWYFENYSDGSDATEQDEKFSSRVRVKFEAISDGGAYAKARLRMSDTIWDGTNLTRDTGEGSNLYTDYAYIGVPIGPVTVEAGLMPVDLTMFSYWDRREDMLSIKWENDMTALQFWYMKNAEYTDDDTDTTDDEDINTMSLVLDQKFSNDFQLKAAALYHQDQTEDDMSGLSGLLQVQGSTGAVDLTAELAYAEADVLGSDDDGIGGYIQGSTNFGATSISLNSGFTKDGFEADDDFGFIMIGGASAITPEVADNIGSVGDTIWLGGTFGYKVTGDLSVKGVLVYADVNDYGSMYEVSGGLDYALTEGASIEWVAGYLGINDDDEDAEDPIGTALTLNVNF